MLYYLKQIIGFSLLIIFLSSCSTSKRIYSFQNFNNTTLLDLKKTPTIESFILDDSTKIFKKYKDIIQNTTVSRLNDTLTQQEVLHDKKTKTTDTLSTTTSINIEQPLSNNGFNTTNEQDLPVSTNAIAGLYLTTLGVINLLASIFYLIPFIALLSLFLFPLGKFFRIAGAKEIKEKRKRGWGYVKAGRIIGYTFTILFVISLYFLFLLVSEGTN